MPLRMGSFQWRVSAMRVGFCKLVSTACCLQVDEDNQTVTVAAGITQRALLDYLSGEA